MPPLVFAHTQRFFSSNESVSPARSVAPVHAHEGDGAVPAGGGRMADRLCQELRERLRRHLAGSHGELAMTHPAKPADMTVDRHVVGWVREDEIRGFSFHQSCEALGIPRVAAQEPMTIEEPDVSAPGDGRSGVAERSYLILRFTCPGRGALFRFLNHEVDLGEREARELDIELEID